MISSLGDMIRRFIKLVLSNLIGQLQLVMEEINKKCRKNTKKSEKLLLEVF